MNKFQQAWEKENRNVKKFLLALITILKNRIFFEKKCNIHKTAQIEKMQLVKISETAEIRDYVIIRTYTNEVNIGEYTQINPFCVIYGGSGVNIGNNVMIAPHCTIAAGNHDFKQTEIPMRFAGSLTRGPINIKDNVWIGANSTICDGVTIEEEAVIAAGSVVTKNVGKWEVWGGIPAVRISCRR